VNIGIVTTWADCGAGYVSLAYANSLHEWSKVFVYARGSYMRPSDFWRCSLGFPVEVDCTSLGLTRVCKAQFLDWIRHNQIGTLIFNEQRFWQTVLWARDAGVRCVAYVDYYTSQTLPLFHLFDGLLCNTRRHCAAMQGHPSVCYLPWGTDCSLYKPAVKPLGCHALRFLHSAGAGGPNDRKGTGTAIAAFRALAGDATLRIDSQIALSQTPRDWQVAVSADPRIKWVHQTTRPPHSYHEADVYVYPSRLEGIGLTIAESLASGVPVISTDVQPMNEFVDDGRTGFLVPANELRARHDGYLWPEATPAASDVLSAMQRYVDSPELCQLHGSAARADAERRMNWKVNSAPLRGWIKRLDAIELTDSEVRHLRALAGRLDRMNEPSPVDLLQRAAVDTARAMKRRLSALRGGCVL
jgi:1,2-diacylglycerol 3-alpha-glucosyltransferase